MIALSKKRIFTFDHIEREKVLDDAGNQKMDTTTNQPEFIDNIEASVTFDFPFAEDKDYASIQNMIRRKLIPDATSEKDKKHNDQEIQKLAGNVQDMLYRKALVACTGFQDEDGNDITIKDADGKLIELNQKMVYEWVKTTDIYGKVVMASSGLSSKNSETGVTESSTTDGSPESV